MDVAFMTSQRTSPLHSLTNEDFPANFREKRIAPSSPKGFGNIMMIKLPFMLALGIE
jgi:hypothetical protein